MRQAVTLHELPAFMAESKPQQSSGTTRNSGAIEDPHSSLRRPESVKLVREGRPRPPKLHRLGALFAFGAGIFSFSLVTYQGTRGSKSVSADQVENSVPAHPAAPETPGPQHIAAKPLAEEPQVAVMKSLLSPESLAAQEFRALRNAAQGRTSDALVDYRQLSRALPDQPALEAAVRILEQKSRKQEERSR